MGLWNVLTGRVAHWNKLQRESHALYYPRLRQHPGTVAEGRWVRDYFYAYYLSSLTTLTQFLFEDGVPAGKKYRHRINSLTVDGLHGIIAAYQARHILGVSANEPRTEELIKQDGFKISRITELYARDQEFATCWTKQWARNDATTLGDTLYRSIAQALGLPAVDPQCASEWGALSVAIARYQSTYFKTAGFSGMVDMEIAKA